MSTLTAVTPAPPRPTVWTVQRFHDVREAGYWDGRRAILIRGTVWELGPMNPPHATPVTLAIEALRSAFGAGFHPRVQLPLVLSLDTDPFPDLAIVKGTARDYAATHPTRAALVLEVADSSLDLDTTVKAELYATGRHRRLLGTRPRRPTVARLPRPDALLARRGGVSHASRLRLRRFRCTASGTELACSRWGFATLSPDVSARAALGKV